MQQDIDTEALAADIESGAYFTNSRRWYSELFHTPIAQRSYYVLVILLALLNMYFAILSFLGVFPIVVPVPFITYSNNIWEDIPHIRRIATDETENKNSAVMQFLIASYVENRESYDLPLFELRYRNIWSQSTKNVFEEYKRQIDATNPYSFYRLYTNRSRRVVDILSLDFDRSGDLSQAHVTFEATVISLADGQEIGHSKWRADFTYKYTNFAVDQSLESVSKVARFFGLTGDSLKASGEKRKVVPMTFIVSDYKVKELLE
jgi:type IV secretory pathway component VirB8